MRYCGTGIMDFRFLWSGKNTIREKRTVVWQFQVNTVVYWDDIFSPLILFFGAKIILFSSVLMLMFRFSAQPLFLVPSWLHTISHHFIYHTGIISHFLYYPMTLIIPQALSETASSCLPLLISGWQILTIYQPSPCLSLTPTRPCQASQKLPSGSCHD